MNVYLKDYYRYLNNARELELEKIGMEPIARTGDYLMDNVRVYDVTDRRHAGINDVLQDLWFADCPFQNPKAHLRNTKEKALGDLVLIRSYRDLQTRWSRKTWLYVFLVHRITGSAASYVCDHGYRNTIVPELGLMADMNEMVAWIREYTGKMFTSIGCQIPGFPKLPDESEYSKQSKYYLCGLAPLLIHELDDWLSKGGYKTHRQVLNWLADWNRGWGFNAFWFQYSLFASDISDYFPNLVDEDSHVHYGTNSVKTLKLFGPRREWDKIVEDTIKAHPYMDLKPKGIENSLCDYWKYHKSWIPKGYVLGPDIDKTRLVRKSIL